MSDGPAASRRRPSPRPPRSAPEPAGRLPWPPQPARPSQPPRRPRLVHTQGDPAGIGPEILLRLLTLPAPRAEETGASPGRSWQPLLVAERAALEALRSSLPGAPWDRLRYLPGMPAAAELDALTGDGAHGGDGGEDADEADGAVGGHRGDVVPVLDPVGSRRSVMPGSSGPADAAGAMAALDAGIALVREGVADALVTAPVSKESIARHLLPDFRGHTDYLAAACGLERYGRDYLMAFLAPDLQVALLTVHLPLAQALAAALEPRALDEALACLDRHAGGRIALAGLNPHAGEGGLLGGEEREVLGPAVERARRAGRDVQGPESADSLFARARRGEFDWVLALYHDQGLIAVKTAAFGLATNWTLGLPFLRTSVDHGTAFHLAGRGKADARPLAEVVETTLKLAAGELPRRRAAQHLPE
jgi:4-hydroxythreonine-4-phosphate dehydrogenase